MMPEKQNHCVICSLMILVFLGAAETLLDFLSKKAGRRFRKHGILRMTNIIRATPSGTVNGRNSANCVLIWQTYSHMYNV